MSRAREIILEKITSFRAQRQPARVNNIHSSIPSSIGRLNSTRATVASMRDMPKVELANLGESFKPANKMAMPNLARLR